MTNKRKIFCLHSFSWELVLIFGMDSKVTHLYGCYGNQPCYSTDMSESVKSFKLASSVAWILVGNCETFNQQILCVVHQMTADVSVFTSWRWLPCETNGGSSTISNKLELSCLHLLIEWTQTKLLLEGGAIKMLCPSNHLPLDFAELTILSL